MLLMWIYLYINTFLDKGMYTCVPIYMVIDNKIIFIMVVKSNDMKNGSKNMLTL